MYAIGNIFPIILLIILFLIIINHCHVKSIQKKICRLSCCEKVELLNELTKPFGFTYTPCQDLFTSRADAWQRELGYCELYDRSAPLAQMVIDCEPFYFDYKDRTWLIELWKGQYGINTGAEIGIYHADTLLSPKEYSTALFQAADNEEMLEMSMELFAGRQQLFYCYKRHWWLTGFLMGCFSHPADLTLKASIQFPEPAMLEAFLNAVIQRGYPKCAYCVEGTSITLIFRHPYYTQPCQLLPLSCSFSQWKNKCFCRLFLWITQPFVCSVDQLLYLYELLPFAFRRTIQICKPRRYKVSRRTIHELQKKIG